MSKKNAENVGSIETVTYGPIGISTKLQREITQLMHELVKLDGRVTLAELGYLHMNTITFVEDHVEVKVYFHPKLATTAKPQFNGRAKYVPNEYLNIFKDYMFVGDLADCVGYDTITVPKYKIYQDKLGRPALSIHNTKKTEDDEEVLVLKCNLALIVAAINGVDLSDPNFTVKYETVASAKKSKKSDDGESSGNIVATVGGNRKEFPISVTTTFSMPYTGYDPDQAVPYLMKRLNEQQAAHNNKKKLAKRVSDEAASITKKNDKKQYKNYHKYR